MLPNAPLLPRGSSTQWKEAHQSLSFHLRGHPNAWIKSLAVAGILETRLQALFPMLDDLCLNTCPWCPEPCCLTAKVWFDFKDLLFLHLARKPIPLNPPSSALEDTCRYLSQGLHAAKKQSSLDLYLVSVPGSDGNFTQKRFSSIRRLQPDCSRDKSIAGSVGRGVYQGCDLRGP